MIKKIDCIIFTDFVIDRNHSELYSSISRASSKRIERNISLLESLLIVRISVVVDLSFIT